MPTPAACSAWSAAATPPASAPGWPLIRRRGPWRGLDDVELATLEYVDWFNHRRLQHPPVEYEDDYYRQIAGLTEDRPAERSLH